jgi:hypothetical protein
MSAPESPDALPAQPSSEVVRWLQSLALPVWARGILVAVFLAVMFGGLALVAWGAWNRDRESMTAAIGLLTVALPVSLVVIGLVFGQRSEKRLADLTHAVLDTLIASQVKQLACAPRGLQFAQISRTGCRATYRLTSSADNPQGLRQALQFSVELNVRKVNLMFSLPEHINPQGSLDNHPALVSYRHVIEGARAEGYRLNHALAEYGDDAGGKALLFYRKLPDDFLLRPIEKLYFTQDLGFFVRGIVEAQQASQPAGMRLEGHT